MYELTLPTEKHETIPVEISVEGNHLMAAMSGGVKYALTAVSQTKFYFEGFHLEFVKNDQGAVAYLLAQTVEGDFKAIRK